MKSLRRWKGNQSTCKRLWFSGLDGERQIEEICELEQGCLIKVIALQRLIGREAQNEEHVTGR